MKRILNGLLLTALVLTLACAIIYFGAATIEFAVPMYVGALVLAALWVVKLLVAKQVSWTNAPLHIAVVAFALYGAARYCTSPIEYESRLELFHIGLYTLIYFLVAANFYRQRDRTVVVITLMILALAETVYGGWQFATGADVVLDAERPDQYHGRASGTYVCPNHLAGLLEIVFALTLARVAILRSTTATVERGAMQKILEGFVALVVLGGIVMSLSRGGWIATGFSLIVFLIWSARARAISPAVAAVTLGLFVVAAFAALGMPAVRHRLAETIVMEQNATSVEVKDVTFAGRTMMWHATLKMIQDRPVLGSGPNTWEWFHLQHRDPRWQRRPRYAHSDVLQVASDYGLVGFTLVAAIFGCFFWQTARLSGPNHSSEQRAFAIGAATAVTAILFHSLVDFNMHIPANAMIVVTLMGLTVAVDSGEHGTRRFELGRPARFALALMLVTAVAVTLRFGTPMARAAALTTWGNACKQTLDWDKARDFYQRAIATDAKSPEPYARMGDVYRSQSALRIQPKQQADRLALARQAVDAYRQSLALNPFQSEVMLRLASAYELAGDNPAALKTYEQALVVDPNNGFNYLRLGIFYRHIGDDTRAAEAFEKSAQLSSADSIAMVNIEDLRRKGQPHAGD